MKKDLPACPVEITMGLIGDKWKVLIIRDLLTGTKRFGELKKSLNNLPKKQYFQMNLTILQLCPQVYLPYT